MLMMPYHYFASSASSWVANDDLETCLRIQRKEDERDIKGGLNITGCNVYRVPGDNKTARYEINFYVPQVEGIELVAEVTYNQKEIIKKEKGKYKSKLRVA